MSAFEFFFSFYGLLLGLSVAVIATGLATAIQHRKTVRIGWMTPLLALFVALDIASFWESAWVNFRDLPFSYGLLVAGLVVALVYFIAASLVFPHEVEPGTDFSAHFWANKRIVLLLTITANLLLFAAIFAIQSTRGPEGLLVMVSYGATMTIYLVLTLLAAFAKRPALFVTVTVLHILIYLAAGVAPFLAQTAPSMAILYGEGPGS